MQEEILKLQPILEYSSHDPEAVKLLDEGFRIQCPDPALDDIPNGGANKAYSVTFTLNPKLTVLYKGDIWSTHVIGIDAQYNVMVNALSKCPLPKKQSFVLFGFFELTQGGVIHCHAILKTTYRALHEFCNYYKRATKSFTQSKECFDIDGWWDYMKKDQEADSPIPIKICN